MSSARAPNGLAAGNLLVDAGWSVEIFEARDQPGGAVRSDRGVHPDGVSDVFSAFCPLAPASPLIAALGLEREGLGRRHAPHVLAHPLLDGRCAVLDRDRRVTAEALASFAPGDGDAWLALCDLWDGLEHDLTAILFTPFPPVRAGGRPAARLRAAGGLRFARRMLLPARRFGEEEFEGEGGRLLLAGNALHADLSPEAAGSGGFGRLMAMLGQTHGFPVPAGGSSALIDAPVRRFVRRGGVLHRAAPVAEVVVRGGRAVGVRTADGDAVPARRAVLADVSAPDPYTRLPGRAHVPPGILADLRRFQWDFATFTVDWALHAPVPWSAPPAAGAGTVHLAEGVDELTRFAARIAMKQVPDRPFAVMGQMTTAGPARSPRGTESAWASTHVPHRVTGDAGGAGLTGAWDEREAEATADRVEEQAERYAPGFRRRIGGAPRPHPAHAPGAGPEPARRRPQRRHHQPPPAADLPACAGHGPPRDPVPGLYLPSAPAHPGGGVHGAPGANAAQAALRARSLGRRVLSGAQRGLSGRSRGPH
ncbi:NAD(P)/FAD-dependent oxidoreductase [Streptomyces tremellae]|uniref:Pyridine nucleotide-disulfide oxidoreductase domain-containing protein 2 n=1 Tax=Streptomyces tremellae TaxID=1124239 RepID=A0ABP7ETS2_9ACTN